MLDSIFLHSYLCRIRHKVAFIAEPNLKLARVSYDAKAASSEGDKITGV